MGMGPASRTSLARHALVACRSCRHVFALPTASPPHVCRRCHGDDLRGLGGGA